LNFAGETTVKERGRTGDFRTKQVANRDAVQDAHPTVGDDPRFDQQIGCRSASLRRPIKEALASDDARTRLAPTAPYFLGIDARNAIVMTSVRTLFRRPLLPRRICVTFC